MIRRFPKGNSRRGMTIMLVMWIAIVMGLIYYSLMENLSLDTRLTTLQRMDMRAFYAARIGLARGVTDLMNDMIVDTSIETDKFDSLADAWARRDIVDVPAADGQRRRRSSRRESALTYSVLVQDEDSKININFCSFELMQGLLMVMGYNEDEAKAISEAVMDWRDPDNRPIGGQGESEALYYAAMQAQDTGRRRNPDVAPTYISKNDMFTTLEELLDVYGVTPELFYDGVGGSRIGGGNTRSRRSGRGGGSGRRRPGRRADVFERITRPDGTSLGEARGLRDFFTVWSSGYINVNTAPQEVLAALAISEGQGIDNAMSWAEEVVQNRGGDMPDQDQAFKNINEFSSKMRMTGKPKRAGIRGLTVTSQTFRITAVGRMYMGEDRRAIEHSMMVVCQRTLAMFPLDNLAEGPQSPIWGEVPYEPPFYKKFRQDPKNPANAFEPNLEIMQWVEW